MQETLDACTVENVRQMKHAFKALMMARSRAYRHPYQTRLQLLDVDMTGLPCGRQAEKASKGYFANKPHRYGRQMARVVATHYEEVVLDWVGPGNVQLNKVLRPLIEETEWMLDLDAGRRTRIVLRIDASGDGINDVNWLLKRGYHIHSKDVSLQRAAGSSEEARRVVERRGERGCYHRPHARHAAQLAHYLIGPRDLLDPFVSRLDLLVQGLEHGEQRLDLRQRVCG